MMLESTCHRQVFPSPRWVLLSSEWAVRSDVWTRTSEGRPACLGQPVPRALFLLSLSACILSRHHLNLPSIGLVGRNVGTLPGANAYKWGFSAAVILS